MGEWYTPARVRRDWSDLGRLKHGESVFYADWEVKRSAVADAARRWADYLGIFLRVEKSTAINHGGVEGKSNGWRVRRV